MKHKDWYLKNYIFIKINTWDINLDEDIIKIR
jgi:hypothetical protein